jgi:hypothetical protein
VQTDAFEVVERNGQAEVIVALFESRRGDWAPCNSLDLAFYTRPVGGGPDEVGVYMCPTLVNQPFNSEAAYWTMGVSRSLAEIDVAYEPDVVTFSAQEPGGAPSTFRLPRGDGGSERTTFTTRAYTCIGDRHYAVPFEMELPTGPVDLGKVEVELGDGPVADALRTLGLPGPLTFAGWGEGLTGRFHAGRLLDD